MVGAQGSKEHSLSFQVNSKARDEGGEPEPSAERSELRNLLTLLPGGPAAAVGAACHHLNAATSGRPWSVTTDSLSCRDLEHCQGLALGDTHLSSPPSAHRLGVPLPCPCHTVPRYRATLQRRLNQ